MADLSRDDIISGYLDEVNTYIPILIRNIETLKKNPQNSDVIEELHRLVHTVKGASAMVGVKGLSQIAFQMEETLDEVIAGRLRLTNTLFTAMANTINIFRHYCDNLFKNEIAARALLKKTVIAFRKAKGLSVAENNSGLQRLLQSVPEYESIQIQPVSAHKQPAEKDIQNENSCLPTQALIESFYEEADEHIENLRARIRTLTSHISEPVVISEFEREIIRQIIRFVHTLKGASAVMGFADFAGLAHNLEDLLDWLFEKATIITPEIVNVLAESADLIESSAMDPEIVDSQTAAKLMSDYRRIMNDKDSAGIEMLSDRLEKGTAADASLRQILKLRVDTEKIDEIVNLSSELIIALSGFEQKMDLMRETVNELELSRRRLRNIARDMEVGYEVKALDRLGAGLALSSGLGGAGQLPVGLDDFDALELDRYSKLNLIIRSLNESAIDVGAINTELTNIHSEFDGHLTRQQVLLSELQDKMMQIRMTPMTSITARLHQTVREIADRLGKKARLLIEGSDIELDRQIWEKLADPLMHLISNAVDHGIETPSQRRARSKSPIGIVKLQALREGNQVIIRISDDGAGLDVEAIRAVAELRGLTEKINELSESELQAFIFQPGFTTRSDVNQISGRGVGMDVVKENIGELKGSIQVLSKPGRWTRFDIRIPLTLAAVRALIFSVGNHLFALALSDISEIVRLAPDQITSEPDRTIRLGDTVLPLYDLIDIFKIGPVRKPIQQTGYPLILVLHSGERRAAIITDAIVAQKEIVIKNLGSHLRYVRCISGATIMGDGSVVPIINAGELLGVKTVVHEIISVEPEPLTQALEILVVDDSVSIRQVVSRLMETQGWNVRTARDGIDALEKLRETKPDLIVLDIEMPRMNGYEFMSALRVQPDYQDIPVVILTSRTAKKHREKSSALGAQGFIVKPYNEDEFISLILKLTKKSEVKP
jgi:chemosensory pili system protein ChpA (sensor histidine kinase/response regulator)